MASVPVHVVTGFLGAGKTTLLNRLLAAGGFANTAVIINEFGDVGIDHLLVEAVEGGEPMIELSDGCLCCTVRSDLVDTLFQINERIEAGAALDRVVIETTGLADPAPVLQAVMATPGLNERFHVASLVTVVCAATGLASLEDHEEARSQVALADRIVLTKTDLEPASDALIARLAAINPLVEPVDAAGDGFVLALDDSSLAQARPAAGEPHGHHRHHHDVNRHDASIEAFTLTHDAQITAATVEMFADLLRSSMPRELLRMKGVVWTTEKPDRPLVIHGVQSVFHPPVRLDSWKGREPETRLVVIARNGNRAHIEGLFAAFTGQIAPDRPDRQALTDNPLAIPGM
ncbi:CobW family GTP-binding protein [Oricola indica]|jgi:G3E family GTPase|uniref:CobW family GTP-binding protein n=1 Tax=Oricola indica TaxID=2872591 RepID=UPI001CBFB818|nr:GTP-binding protein [Oricola indica]